MPKSEVGMHSADFMEVPPVSVAQDVTIDDAARLMWEKNVGSVIVIDDAGTMVGIVTEKDVVFSVSKSMTGRNIPVSSIMSRTRIKGTPGESIATAVEKMRTAGVRHLPVVDKSGKPLGMISMRDALEVSGPLLKIALRSTKKTKPTKKTEKKRA